MHQWAASPQFRSASTKTKPGDRLHPTSITKTCFTKQSESKTTHSSICLKESGETLPKKSKSTKLDGRKNKLELCMRITEDLWSKTFLMNFTTSTVIPCLSNTESTILSLAILPFTDPIPHQLKTCWISLSPKTTKNSKISVTSSILPTSILSTSPKTEITVTMPLEETLSEIFTNWVDSWKMDLCRTTIWKDF